MKHQPGFTLLEVLVALAVLAIAMGAIIHAATQSINTVATLRDQTFASWVTLNQVNTCCCWRRNPGPKKAPAPAMSNWPTAPGAGKHDFSKPKIPDLRRVEVTVRASETGSELDKLIAFKGKTAGETRRRRHRLIARRRGPTRAAQDQPTKPKQPQPAP